MAEGIDTGLVRIDKIQNKIFESRTRVISGCNPKHPKQASEQRTMDSFRYGCDAIKGIFPGMMIRRIDFAMFAATWDIEDKEKIYYPETPTGPQQVTVEDLQALIFYAWNLKPEQIIIDDGTAHYIRKTAKYMSDKFGEPTISPSFTLRISGKPWPGCRWLVRSLTFPPAMILAR